MNSALGRLQLRPAMQCQRSPGWQLIYSRLSHQSTHNGEGRLPWAQQGEGLVVSVFLRTRALGRAMTAIKIRAGGKGKRVSACPPRLPTTPRKQIQRMPRCLCLGSCRCGLSTWQICVPLQPVYVHGPCLTCDIQLQGQRHEKHCDLPRVW